MDHLLRAALPEAMGRTGVRSCDEVLGTLEEGRSLLGAAPRLQGLLTGA